MSFSRRLAWSERENRLAGLLRDRRAAGAALLDLTESNPTRVGLDYPAAEIEAAFSDPGAAAYDPSPRGHAAAREAVAAHYARRGLAVPPERIILTASSSEAYGFLFKLLTDPGDAVLVPRPSYPLFDYLAALESVEVEPYALPEEGRFAIEPGTLARALEAAGPWGPRAIVVVNPNNPTGSALRETEWRTIEGAAGRRDAAIIADEVFFDYRFPNADGVLSALAFPSTGAPSRALTFTLGGLSKSCGLPQMKLGWIAAGGPEHLVRAALDRLELIADTYLSVGTPVQKAAPRLLAIGETIRERITRRVLDNRAALLGAVSGPGPCRVLEADGGWSAVLRVPAVLPEEDLVLRLLGEDDVLVHPGYFFDFPREAYLVLSLLPDPGLFQDGLRRILARVERLGA